MPMGKFIFYSEKGLKVTFLNLHRRTANPRMPSSGLPPDKKWNEQSKRAEPVKTNYPPSFFKKKDQHLLLVKSRRKKKIIILQEFWMGGPIERKHQDNDSFPRTAIPGLGTQLAAFFIPNRLFITIHASLLPPSSPVST